MITGLPLEKNGIALVGVELILSRSNYKYYEFNKNDISIKLATGKYVFGGSFQMVSPYYCKKIYESDDPIVNCDTMLFPDASKHGWFIETIIDNGFLSSNSGPALKQYNKNKISSISAVDAIEYWFHNGLPHREDGCAVFVNNYKYKEECSYWLDGIKLTFDQFWNKQKDTIYAPKIMAMILGQKEDKDEK